MRVYVFPDQVTIKKHLLTSGVWGDHYLKQKGVDEIVCNLAAKRFANSEREEFYFNMDLKLITFDLKRGKDGFTNERINRPDFPKGIWDLIEDSLMTDLQVYAQNSPD